MIDKAALAARAKEEMIRFVGIFLYLLLILGLFQLHSYLVLKEHGLPFASWGFAVINALVLGKVMLVAESLEFGRTLARNRLIYAVILRSLLFALLFLLFDSVEKVVVEMVKTGSFHVRFPVSDRSLLETLVVAAILAISLIPFFLFTEFSRLLGEGRMHQLLMGPLARSDRERAPAEA
jgi:hypothetical protein